MFCTQCGARVDASENICPSCGFRLENETAPLQPGNEQASYAAAVPQSAPSQHVVRGQYDRDVKLSDGEIIVRQYHCSTSGLKSKMEGYITVTNKRIIHKSRGNTSRGVSEILIETYQGFVAFHSHGWRVSRLISFTRSKSTGFSR
jgi:predicted amidophosphoribosyltransferase